MIKAIFMVRSDASICWLLWDSPQFVVGSVVSGKDCLLVFSVMCTFVFVNVTV